MFFRLLWCCFAALLALLLQQRSLLVLASPLSLGKRDADFLSVRTRLDEDHSGKSNDPNSQKYFHESTFDFHYDGRFGEKKLGYYDQQVHLVDLIRSYLSTMNDIGADTWIMHGTLLGWWWNRKILPWDSDLDVQVTNATMYFLAKYYNLTVFHYILPDEPEGRDYMLEINSHYDNPSIKDTDNVIDARWIDMSVGMFIDITSVRPNQTARDEGVEGALMCKDRHHYLESDIFPLRDSWFHDIPVKIPFEYVRLLEEEYGKKSLTQAEYHEHKFNHKTNLWDPLPGVVHR